MLNNFNYDKIKEDLKGSTKYKIMNIALAGVITVSMVPSLSACAKEEISEQALADNPALEYFDESFFENGCLYFEFDTPTVALETLEEHGDEITDVWITDSYAVDDLSLLVEYCPNIERVHIERAPSITDLSFIYSLPNLKTVEIDESAFVTPELVEYLDQKGISHNITEDDLLMAAEVDRIISEIIDEDMTDEEKIQAITCYVVDNYKYKFSKARESGDQPLTTMLQTNSGVCSGYAYLTNVLLRKAGINSYEVINEHLIIPGHAWNIIELDGKYYYLDTTNVNQIPIVSRWVLENYNIGLYYMTDPDSTLLSVMSDYDSNNVITIPDEMIEDIEAGENEKTIVEKYGTSVPVRIIECLIPIIAVSYGIKLTQLGISAISNTASNKKHRKAAAKRNKHIFKKKRNNIKKKSNNRTVFVFGKNSKKKNHRNNKNNKNHNTKRSYGRV